jgi:7-keto-8-aminopelargonate synthetase-like enzyme
MWILPGVFFSFVSLLTLVDPQLIKTVETIWKHKHFLWTMYRIRRNTATLNQTFLMMVKYLANIPFSLTESPWQTYHDVKEHHKAHWPYLLRIDDTTEESVKISLPDGTKSRTGLNMSSYSYVNAVKETEIRDFVVEEMVAGNYTFGNHGPRMLGGNNLWLCKLEEELAKFTGRKAALCFSSGFLACKTVIQAISAKGDLILGDARLHESLRDGIRCAKAKGTATYFFRHNDWDQLEQLLIKHRSQARETYIVIESVYSMHADFANLPKCQELALKYNAKIILDEAHGLGIVGKTGRGLEELQNCPKAAWLIVGSLTKALGSVGGYVVGDAKIIDFLHFFATGTLFSAPMAITNAIAAYGTLYMIQKHPEWLDETRKNMLLLTNLLKPLESKYGVIVQTEEGSPLIAFIMKDFQPLRVLKIAQYMFEHNIYTAAVNPPACELREPRLRITAPRGTKTEDLHFFVQTLDDALRTTQDIHDPLLSELSSILTYLGF